MLTDLGQAEEALEGRGLHLQDVAEAHVVFDERENLRAVFVREAQPPQDRMRDARAQIARGINGESGGASQAAADSPNDRSD